MNNKSIVVRNRKGRPVQGATVTVYDGGTSTPATIYSDDGVTPVTGAALTTDADGRATFYAADVGTPGYDLTVTGTGITAYTISDVRMHDPYDANVPSVPTVETYLAITDGVTAPTNTSGLMKVYVDVADGVLKTIDGDGNVLTLGSGAGIDTTAIHDNVAAEISAVTEKATPVNNDLFLIEDSADSNNKKRVTLDNISRGQFTTSNTFSDGDTTPSVAAGSGYYETANTGITAIEGFDDGFVGQIVVVKVTEGFTDFDFTAVGAGKLRREKGTTWTNAANGDFLFAIYTGALWVCFTCDAVGADYT